MIIYLIITGYQILVGMLTKIFNEKNYRIIISTMA